MAYFFAFVAFVLFLMIFYRWRLRRGTVSALDAVEQFNSRELGGIPLDGAVEFFGKVGPTAGLVTGPRSGEQGVWWRVLVTEHWEEETGSGDNRRWEDRSRVVSDEISGYPLLITDQFGTVLLEPVDIDFRDCPKTFYQRDDDDGVINFSISLGSDKRDRWIETEEWLLPDAVNVLALAHVGQKDDTSRFLHSGEGQHSPFLVPTDSPEDYAAAAEASSGRWGLAAILMLLLTLALLAVGLIS